MRLAKLLLEVAPSLDHRAATDELVRAGALTPRDEATFWFAVPGVARFVKQLEQGRREIVQRVWRRMHHEMPREAAESLSLRFCKLLSPRFLVRDALGTGALELVATSSGAFLRARRATP